FFSMICCLPKLALRQRFAYTIVAVTRVNTNLPRATITARGAQPLSHATALEAGLHHLLIDTYESGFYTRRRARGAGHRPRRYSAIVTLKGLQRFNDQHLPRSAAT